MSPLRAALADYLTVRRALGFKLEKAEWLLGDFVAYLEERGEETITHRARAGLGDAAGRSSELALRTALGCSRLRRLPGDDRPRLRGASAELMRARGHRSDPLHLLRAPDRRPDRGSGDAAPAHIWPRPTGR